MGPSWGLEERRLRDRQGLVPCGAGSESGPEKSGAAAPSTHLLPESRQTSRPARCHCSCRFWAQLPGQSWVTAWMRARQGPEPLWVPGPTSGWPVFLASFCWSPEATVLLPQPGRDTATHCHPLPMLCSWPLVLACCLLSRPRSSGSALQSRPVRVGPWHQHAPFPGRGQVVSSEAPPLPSLRPWPRLQIWASGPTGPSSTGAPGLALSSPEAAFPRAPAPAAQLWASQLPAQARALPLLLPFPLPACLAALLQPSPAPGLPLPRGASTPCTPARLGRSSPSCSVRPLPAVLAQAHKGRLDPPTMCTALCRSSHLRLQPSCPMCPHFAGAGLGPVGPIPVTHGVCSALPLPPESWRPSPQEPTFQLG